MDYELDPIPTEEWLAALGHDQSWLERWTARPVIDKEAVTEWTMLGEHQSCALIQNRLLTGRTHQIRVHMKEALGHPILGDPIYGHPSRQKVPTPRLMLHAWKLAFQHPIHDQPMSFEAVIPPEFEPWTKVAGI
jgi:23S rRNA pseudouridine1911/1915/1917 synthase